jgi:hypothetical protein
MISIISLCRNLLHNLWFWSSKSDPKFKQSKRVPKDKRDVIYVLIRMKESTNYMIFGIQKTCWESTLLWKPTKIMDFLLI